jgi:hypothetical protein
VATTSPLTVTYTPQISSTHPISGFEGGIAYFQLDATDVNGQPVYALSVPFTLTVNVDMSIVDSWDIEIGQVTEDGIPAPSNPSPAGKALPVLARWDDTSQRWAIISTAFDTTSGQLTARDDHFAEFAVLVQRQYGVYLPIVVRR